MGKNKDRTLQDIILCRNMMERRIIVPPEVTHPIPLATKQLQHRLSQGNHGALPKKRKLFLEQGDVRQLVKREHTERIGRRHCVEIFVYVGCIDIIQRQAQRRANTLHIHPESTFFFIKVKRALYPCTLCRITHSGVLPQNNKPDVARANIWRDNTERIIYRVHAALYQTVAHAKCLSKISILPLHYITLPGKDSTITDKATIYLRIKTDAATQCAAASIFYKCNQLIT